MLEKPALDDERITACLAAEYGLDVTDLDFLPLGADMNTAVYRAAARGGAAYFVKLRRGKFGEASVLVPAHLARLGLRQVIPPIAARTGRLRARLGGFTLTLYPFVEGRNGFDRPLSRGQWAEFGAALKQFHSAAFPPEVTAGLPREDFSPRGRESVKLFLERVRCETFDEPAAAELAAFLRTRRAETLALVDRAGRLALELQEQPPPFILCHGDIHAWNLLVADGGAFYMVDWDTLLFAPRERDLMYIGAGLGGRAFAPAEEEALFYRGYGPAAIDPAALAYYRYELIVEDIAVFCGQILSPGGDGADRRQSLDYLKSNFLPGGALEMAVRSDGTNG